MRVISIALIAGMAASPAFAQHEGHTTTDPAAQAAAAAEQSVENESTTADPHAGHVMPAAEPVVEVDAAQEHAGHDMATMTDTGTAAPETATPQEAFSGPVHAADTIFDPSLMAAMRENLRVENGDIRTFWITADQVETRIRKGGDEAYLWDAQGWYGGDINKLWFKSEGEGDYNQSPEHAEVQALWSHAIAPFWDFQAGVKHDFWPKPTKTYAAVGIQGLMPYQFEIDAATFLSEDGDLSARLEAEYDQRITQRLILQPRLEMDISGANIPEIGIGSGLTSAEMGLRLRYEIVREFAPYLGVEYSRSFGKTADYLHSTGETNGGWNFLIGIRTWF